MSWRLVVRGVCVLWLVPFSVNANSSRIQPENSIEHLSPESKIEVNSGTRNLGPIAPSLIPRSAGGSGVGAKATPAARAVLGGISSVRSALVSAVAPHCGPNLYKTLCAGQSPKAEEAVVGPYIKKLQKSFAKSQGIRFGGMQSLFSNGIRHSQKPEFKSLYGKYFEHLKANAPPLEGIFNRAKNFLHSAIDKMPLSDNARNSMHGKLKGLQGTMSPNLDKPEEVEEWGTACQPDGMAATAYARPMEKDVMICPGLMMRALAMGGTEELEHYMLHAIGHECMHHMGADIYTSSGGEVLGESPYRTEFASTLSCYARNFSGIDPVKMGGEIAADVGSGKAMAERLRGSTPEQAIKILRASMGPICGTKDDGTHPSDKFRINVILGQDPELASVLGCPKPAQTCSPATQMAHTVPATRPPVKVKNSLETAARQAPETGEEQL